VRQTKPIRQAIQRIGEEGRTPISYPDSGGAEVAETAYNGDRLIVRRVRHLTRPGQLFPTWEHHGFVTDRVGTTVELDADHRRHAEVELAIRDLKAGAGLAHLPSGRFAWAIEGAGGYGAGLPGGQRTSGDRPERLGRHWRISATAAARYLGRGRRGLGSVPPCPGAGSGSRPGLLPRAPGELAGGLLELVHPLPGRREQRRADEHHARKPQQTTDPDQHPSPDQEAAVDLNAPLGCVIAHHLRPFRRSEDGRPEAAVTSRHPRPTAPQELLARRLAASRLCGITHLG
jgi:hypothetical protein